MQTPTHDAVMKWPTRSNMTQTILLFKVQDVDDVVVGSSMTHDFLALILTKACAVQSFVTD